MTQQALERALQPFGLFTMGALHETGQTLVLLGAGAGLWPIFMQSDEYTDAHPDPLDRWSKRVVGKIAIAFEAEAIFPSDGPPYAPFIRWAQGTRQFFQSPTGMLVHPKAGLMISIRAAIRVPDVWPIDPPAHNPCNTCAGRPCVSACPVGALSETAPYDVPACKTFLDTTDGQDCMAHGCKVRRACPISQAFERDPAQSAFHMQSFKGK